VYIVAGKYIEDQPLFDKWKVETVDWWVSAREGGNDNAQYVREGERKLKK